MKILDLVNAQPALMRLSERKMPAKLAFGIAKNLRLVKQELDDFDATRTNMLSQNWKPNPETGRYDIPPEDTLKWNGMYKELLETEVDFKPYILPASLLAQIDISPDEVLAIQWMLEGEL